MSALSPPYRWLPALAKVLSHRLRGAEVEGVLSGRGWISLRLAGNYLWIVALAPMRALWLDSHPLPKEYALALGSHQRSPFGPLLRESTIQGVLCLAGESGRAEGLRLELENGRSLCAAFWPRPGQLWLEDAEGGILSVSPPQALRPRMEPLSEEASGDDFDAGEHARRCRELLFFQVEAAVRRRLRDTLKARKQKAERLVKSLQEEAHEARADAGIRELADLLAANLSRVEKGSAEVEILDFEGEKRTLQLDPALSPAANLDRLYRRCAKAERKATQVAARQEEATRELERARELEREFDELEELGELVDFAESLAIELRPSAPGEHRGGRSRRRTRLPYKIFVLPSGREIWIGKSAADNDELSFKRAGKMDLWLHAGGVEGSHVILRSAGAPPSKAEIQAAAQLAALFSKAKGSTTVPVWLTERKYLRKPRKAPAGMAAPQRTRTLFVTPEQPAGRWLTRESED